MKKFDAESYPLLNLMKRGAVLDELIDEQPPVYPVSGDADVDNLAKLLHIAYKRNTQLDFDQLGSMITDEQKDKLIKLLDRHVREEEQYYKSKRVTLSRDMAVAFEKLSRYNKAVEESFDRIMLTPRPVTYYLPPVTTKMIFANGLAYIKKLRGLLPDLPIETGMLLIDTPHLHLDKVYLLYDLQPGRFSGIIIHDSPQGLHLVDAFTWTMELTESLGIEIQVASTLLAEDEIGPQQTGSIAYYGVVALLFTHFFEVTKVVAEQPLAGDKRYTKISAEGNEYRSNLNYPVNVIDATWYTTLIKSDPFLVTGHWRKQPYGPGRGQYKMKYIGPYQKNGYTRKAKHEAQTDET